MKTYRQAVREEIDYLNGRLDGSVKSLRTPWKRLNNSGIDGLEWGTINIIAAMSGVGKSSWANELVFSTQMLNDYKISVLFFTMEMPARRLISRMISKELKIPVKDLYKSSSDVKSKAKDILKKYEKMDIFYVEKIMSVPRIVETITRFCTKRADEHCLIVYDHTLLIKRQSGMSERESLVELGMQLLMLKKQFPLSQYFLVSQLNRDIESSDRIKNLTLQYPMKKDIFGSDALWQAADTALVLHNPSFLNIQVYGPNKFPTKGLLFAHLLKVREGRPGMFVIKNNARINSFPELTVSELIEYGFKK